MSETSIKQNSLCLICGLRGTHDIYLTSGLSTVSATGTQLGKFLYKIISEEPCYSISEVICQQCYLLLDRLDAYQARAAEINLHISDRYKDTKLGLIGCKKRISDLIVNSLSNIKSFKNGTTLNVSDELSVTIFHEALPRSVNKGVLKSVVLSSQQKEFQQTSHLKQFNSDFLRCRTKRRLLIHNLIQRKQIFKKKDLQLYKVANKTGFLGKKSVTEVKNSNRSRPSLKRKLPICLKENSAPKKINNNQITSVSKNIRTNLAICNAPDVQSSLPMKNFCKTDKINVKKRVSTMKCIDKNCENKKISMVKSKSSDQTVTSCLSESLNSINFNSPNNIHTDLDNSNSLHRVSGQTSDNETSRKLLLNMSNTGKEEEESFLITTAEENIECEDADTQNSTSSGSNCSSSSSSSNDSSSSSCSDSSSDDSSSSTEDSDEEEQKYDAKTDINSDSNICDENTNNEATNLKSNIKDNYVGSQGEKDSNIIKKEAPNDVEKDDEAGSDICDQKMSKNVKIVTKNNSIATSAKQSKESKNSKNISEVVDSLDPQFAQAAWMQNSLASSLLQSFLSTSLWMNSAGSPNKNSMNSQNQNKLEDFQNSNSDDMASELFPNTVGSGNDKQKRIELKNTGQSYINTKGKLVEAKRVSPQDCSRCPLRCNGRLNDEKRQAIFADYWGLADYNLQREYLASHMDREERMGPSGITRNVILYYLTYNDAKVQVCRQFFLKTLDISEKASRLVIEKRLKS